VQVEVYLQARKATFLPCVTVALLLCSSCAYKDRQTPQAAAPLATPASAEIDRSRVLNFKGVLKDGAGNRLKGTVGVLFAIYEQKEGGAPVWQEVQNVELNERGVFTTQVGSTSEEGVRPELFSPEKTLWLGMQVLQPGEAERPRIRLLTGPDGLRAVRIVIPDASDQTAKAETAARPGMTDPTQQDQSDPAKRSRRTRRPFQRSRTP
jgi:hypothetical protein